MAISKKFWIEQPQLSESISFSEVGASLVESVLITALLAISTCLAVLLTGNTSQERLGMNCSAMGDAGPMMNAMGGGSECTHPQDLTPMTGYAWPPGQFP